MSDHDGSLQLTGMTPGATDGMGKAGIAAVAVGLLVMLGAACGGGISPLLFMVAGPGLIVAGGLAYILPHHLRRSPAAQNNGVMFSGATTRGAVAWGLGVLITGFYVLLYWWPDTLAGLIRMFDPLSLRLRGIPADHWFMYGSFYTIAVLVMGARALLKYRHNRYQIIRTLSVIFFQLVFAYLIPATLQLFKQPEFYFTYFWPLKPYYLFPDGVKSLEMAGGLGPFMIRWAVMMTFIATPVLTYFFGKRWYCSWVCGCGGLAETAGDPYRQLASTSLKSWKIERWMIYSVLVVITVTTALLWINSATRGAVLGDASRGFADLYGFLIGAVFSGVVGVGFYPIMGARVWCRFGCPMAAVLGIIQKYYSRFRITTNGGQCISCGNCSTYCEMGIDVRWYAQRGENIIRASCVGCGVCANVCPRGVLSLENGPVETRYNGASFVGTAEVIIPALNGEPERRRELKYID